MSDHAAVPKSAKVIHWVSVVMLFLMVAQPSFDNTRALLTGALVMGDIHIDVTIGKMALHLVAMVVGWIGLILFLRRKRVGAGGIREHHISCAGIDCGHYPDA